MVLKYPFYYEVIFLLKLECYKTVLLKNTQNKMCQAHCCHEERVIFSALNSQEVLLANHWTRICIAL